MLLIIITKRCEWLCVSRGRRESGDEEEGAEDGAKVARARRAAQEGGASSSSSSFFLACFNCSYMSSCKKARLLACRAARSFCATARAFSNPLLRSTPSQCLPGRMPKRLGAALNRRRSHE